MEDALHDYQREGVDFLVDHPLGMLGDDPGLGKSAQAIRAAIEADVSEAFILCPAIARVSWEKEIRKWDPARMIRWRVASYDSVGLAANRDGRKELRERMATARRSALILDEAHYLKSPGANRTKAVYGKGGLAEHAKLVWSLSGTFAPNHAGELYPHLKFRGIFAGTKTEFEDQFCKVRDTPFGRQIVGSKNLDKLRELLAPVFLKRRKADVLTQLPPLQFVEEPVEVDKADIPPDLADANVGAGLTDDEFIAALSGQATHVATARRLLGLAKVEPAAQWAEGLLASGVRKLVLFAHHKDVIDRLAERLVEWNPVTLTGSTPHAERTKAVDRFQGDSSCRVFVGQMQAAGTAITLTAAADVGIVEASWTPSDNYQAACRCHRIGQRDGVLARFLHVPGTLDARIARVYRRKAEEIAELFE